MSCASFRTRGRRKSVQAMWLYDPVTGRWARVVWRGGRWVAQCHGRDVAADDELEAVAWAERMAAKSDM